MLVAVELSFLVAMCPGVNRLDERPLLLPEAKRRKISAASDADEKFMYECTRYVWKKKRQESHTELDRKFSTKRMALLYVAKMNCDSVLEYMQKAGKAWSELRGFEYLRPNKPFDIDSFLDMPDDALEDYGRDVGNTLNIHKAAEGTLYQMKAVSIDTVSVDEFVELMRS